MRKSIFTRPESILTAERRAQVSYLRTQGKTLQQIADAIGVNIHTVHDDCRVIREEYMAAIKENRAARLAQEEERLTAIERAAWEEFERSRQPGLESREESGKLAKRTRTTRTRTGDARLLAILTKVSEARRAMYGLDAPAQTAADTERELVEPVIVEVQTRADAKLVMSMGGRIAVQVSSREPGPPTTIDAEATLLEPRPAVPPTLEDQL
jgi:hypothetical protein